MPCSNCLGGGGNSGGLTEVRLVFSGLGGCELLQNHPLIPEPPSLAFPFELDVEVSLFAEYSGDGAWTDTTTV